jgi:hypothetical protein
MLPTPGAFVRNILRELYRATDPFVKSERSLPDFLDKHTNAFIYSPQYIPFLMKEFSGGKFVPCDGVSGGCSRGKETRYVYAEEAERVMHAALVETHQEVIVLYHTDSAPELSMLLLLSRVCAMKENALKIERMSSDLKKTIGASMKACFLHLEDMKEREHRFIDDVSVLVTELQQELTPSESDIELVTKFIINIHHFASQMLDTLEHAKRK